MFRKKHLAIVPEIELKPSDMAPTESPSTPDLLERSRMSVAHLLEKLRREEQELVGEIEERERKLRLAREAIAGFEAAEARWAVEEKRQHRRPNGVHDGPEAA